MSVLVLICDEDPLLTELIEHRLGQRGFSTAVVHDGAAALQFLAGQRPDAVILETMLPVEDGYAVLRHIRADEALKSVPVIVLSSRKHDRDIVEALDLGASDYLTKPFILDELVARLTHITQDGPR